tara:strand:+ start:149 stop:286 length:138 start_codon:yes stop_codon:yes gene_type:complete
MKMDGRNLKELTRMEKKMDYILFGMKMDRKREKLLLRMEKSTWIK